MLLLLHLYLNQFKIGLNKTTFLLSIIKKNRKETRTTFVNARQHETIVLSDIITLYLQH